MAAVALTIEQFTAGWPRTVNGYPWAETVQSPASPTEEFRHDGCRAQRTILTPWDTRHGCIVDFLGFPEVLDSGGTLYISRKVPASHPDYRDIDLKYFLFCTQAQRVEPLGVPELRSDGTYEMRSGRNVAQYYLAKITFLYESLPWEVRADDDEAVQTGGLADEARWARNVVILPRPSTELLSVPTGTFKYVPSAVAVPGYPSKRQPKTDLTVRWVDVPAAAVGIRSVNPGAPSWPIDDTIGKVNSDNFPPGTTLYAPGTLLLEAATPTPHRGAHGIRTWEVEFRFLYLRLGTDGSDAIGHQWLLRKETSPDKLVYREVTTTGATNLSTKADGVSIYDWAPFADLFRVPS